MHLCVETSDSECLAIGGERDCGVITSEVDTTGKILRSFLVAVPAIRKRERERERERDREREREGRRRRLDVGRV